MRPDPDAPRFPSYLDEPEIVRSWVWPIGQAAALATAVAVIALLFLRPDDGLVVWWLWLLPCLPMLWLLAPGLWRNVCPMATLNQLPRRLGLSADRRVPAWLARHAYLVQVAFYFGGISTRALFLDHNGPVLASVMITALIAALVGGLLFTGKSGWCGTFCPLMPVQKLYGQTPALVIKNSHCKTCVGCVKNCYDFNPRLATLADLNDEDRQWVSQRKLFAGTFPGFIVAFFTIPTAGVAQPVPADFHVLQFYALTGLYMLISLGAFFLLEALLPKVSTTFLTAAFGALALNLHNILRFTTTWNLQKPPAVLWIENVLVFLVTLTFLFRTWRQERTVESLQAQGIPLLPRRPHSPEASAGRACPVSFDGGPVVSVAEGSTLLEAAEKAGAAIPTGCRAGVCGVDPVHVTGPAGCVSERTGPESATLTRLGLARPGVRLACSARVHGAATVSLQLPDPLPDEPSQVTPSGRVVIVGNGVAGSTVAQRLRATDERLRITVVSTEARTFYNRMAIGDLITGAHGGDALQLLPTDWAASAEVTTLLNTRAVDIDRQAQRLVLATGETLDYDHLVLATGSKAVIPDLPGIRLPGVFVLRTADDAAAIRTYLQDRVCSRAAVLGAGLLGLEAASLLNRYGVRTALIAGGDRLVRRQLDHRASELLTCHLQGAGLELVLGPRAVAVLGTDHVDAVRLDDATVVAADLLLVCVGSTPRVELARRAGLRLGHGVMVDDAMRTSDPRIFAVGDVAEHSGQVRGLWAPAVDQAEVAAGNLSGEPNAWCPPVAYPAVLKDVGLDVMSIGRVEPLPGDQVLLDEVAENGTSVARCYTKLILHQGVPVGGIVIGDGRRAALLESVVRAGRPLTEDELSTWRRAPQSAPNDAELSPLQRVAC
ncbi:MAG TPA: FAD-dependent oxidoreductase [Kineosporiaceae bacterium]